MNWLCDSGLTPIRWRVSGTRSHGFVELLGPTEQNEYDMYSRKQSYITRLFAVPLVNVRQYFNTADVAEIRTKIEFQKELTMLLIKLLFLWR